MNIALITIDSLRADHVGCYGYGRNTTPNLDHFAERSVVYDNAFSHACATRPSFPSILTSTQGMMYGGYERLAEEQVVLAKPLGDQGYRTGGFHSNVYLRADFGYDQGFDTFHDSESGGSVMANVRQFVKDNVNGQLFDFLKWSYEKTEENVGVDIGSFYIPAEEITDRAIDWVSGDRSEFLWVHYMDPHHPYAPPRERQMFSDEISQREAIKLRQYITKREEEVTGEICQQLIDLYDAEVRFTDHHIGQLLEHLDQVWDDWVAIVTSDHGEEFGEHESMGHENRFYDEHMHVPFLFYDGQNTGRSEQLVGHEDIGPTLLNAGKVQIPETYRGCDIRDSDRDFVIGGWSPHMSNPSNSNIVVWRDHERKCIDNGDVESYNLKHDPKEKNPDSFYPNDKVEKDIAEFRRVVTETDSDVESVEISDEAEERLERLGYKS